MAGEVNADDTAKIVVSMAIVVLYMVPLVCSEVIQLGMNVGALAFISLAQLLIEEIESRRKKKENPVMWRIPPNSNAFLEDIITYLLLQYHFCLLVDWLLYCCEK